MAGKADKETLKRLEEEGKKKGIPARLLEFYHKLFSLQSKAERRIGKARPGLKSGIINERLAHGQPLIKFDELTIDRALLKEVLAEVMATFTEYPDLFGELPRSLEKLKSQPALPKKVARAWFKGTELPATIEAADTNEHLLLEAIVHESLKPFLATQAKSLIKLVDQERWRQGYCPICGGSPDFAFLDKERGARWLLCSRCDSEWLFQRLQCPYCGTQNQEALAYFIDEEGVYRLYVCDECHKYIKAIDLRPIESEISVPLERVLTLDIDRQAQEKGYQPGHSEPPTQTTN